MSAALSSGLVDILRDFLQAYELAGRVAQRYRAGRLAFDEVARLVGDDEKAVLFRLKERCHTLFRGEGAADPAASAESLFDLAVGALFHEAMKFRESFYQRSVYGPKIRALRRGSDADETGLFGEFEKLLGASKLRLDESLQETEALLEQTRRQVRRLLAARRGEGLVTRFLVENAPLVESVFETKLDLLLAEIHGGAERGWLVAARSYLASGFFDRGQRALDEAERRGAEVAGPRAFADGMAAYLEGRGDDAVERLAAWLEAGPDARTEAFADLAWSALSRLAEGRPPADREHTARARALASRLEPDSPRARSRRARPGPPA